MSKKHWHSILFISVILSLAGAQAQEVENFGGGVSIESFDTAVETTETTTPQSSFSVEAIAKAIDETAAEDPSLAENYFDYLKYNEILDVWKFDSLKEGEQRDNFAGSSGKIIEAIKEDASRFVGVANLKFDDSANAFSPQGSVKWIDEKSHKEFVLDLNGNAVNKDFNSILSVTYEKVRKKARGIYDAQLLFFMNVSGKYYFKRTQIQINWLNKELGASGMVSVSPLDDQYIALSETNFSLHVDLVQAKAVLFDSNHNITKTYPITVGAIDARHDIDRQTNFMTLQVPSSLRARGRSEYERQEYQDFDPEHSFLIKKDIWRDGRNTFSRKYPADYMGRPFLGIIDDRFVTQKEDGSLDYSKGYRHVGFHYKIIGTLARGAFSHGCMRTRDRDLYMLYAILNSGPKDKIPVEVRNRLNKFTEIDSLYNYRKIVKKDNNGNDITYRYYTTIFTDKAGPAKVWCKLPYKVYGVKYYNGYHTISGSDCLTATQGSTESYEPIKNFFLGTNLIAPQSKIIPNLEHTPIISRRRKLEEKQDLIPQYRAQFLNREQLAFYIQDTGEEAQKDHLQLLNEMKSAPQQQQIINFYVNPADVVSERRIRRILKRFKRRNRSTPQEVVEYYSYYYYHQCQIRRPQGAKQLQNCRDFQDKIQNAQGMM